MNDLTQAIANTPWTLQTPRLARRDYAGWLAGYVSAVPRPAGGVGHYQWWVEDAARAVVASSDIAEPLTAGAAIADADAALLALARLYARSVR